VNPRYVDTGAIYCGDNLEMLAQFPSESVDLIYLDPPFFSNRQYEVIWGDEAEMRSFEDRWEGGIQHYINWMKERVIEMRRVLRSTGSLYLHCDWHAAHRLKLMLDEVFGENRFQNEIIWYYRGGGVSPTRWGRRHDTIFFYTKGSDWTFNVDPVRTAYSESVMESHPSRYDKSYRGNQVYSGYSPNPLGKHPDDVWPVQPLMPSDRRERLGYPTQKPETLLERIILASSSPGDVVLDPFCGCGTTVVVAERLKREWIGVDISPTAVSIMERRLLKATNGAARVRLENMPVEESDLRVLKPFEFQNWVIQQVSGTHSRRKSGDMGIDGYTFMYNEPIQVKQSERVGRNVIDNFETALRREGKDTGYVVAFSFTRGAHEEVARAKAGGEANIVLVTVAELITAADEVLAPVLADLLRPEPSRRPERPPTPDLIGIFGDVGKNPFDRLLIQQPRPTRTPDELRESERNGGVSVA
jgi:DNA modification methylase